MSTESTNAGPRAWPALPLSEWQPTRDTLQLMAQIVGKIRLANEPLANHWWNVPLYVTARGFSTSLMPHPGHQGFQIDFDFYDHEVKVATTSGGTESVALGARPVASFYADMMDALADLDVETRIWPMPVEIEGAIPFPEDYEHTAYDPEQAQRFWLALTRIEPVFQLFRGRFVGKVSPVHLFWGALDLAVTRFSGQTAPPHLGAAPNCGPQVMLEAYSHAVSSAGYWPGGGGEGFFYSYAYPEPDGYKDFPVAPDGASYSAELGEFVLPYELVRAADDPARPLLAFLQSTYEAAAVTGQWDRAALERPPGWVSPVSEETVASW